MKRPAERHIRLALQLAKSSIEDGRDIYICHALNRAVWQRAEVRDAVIYLKAYIMAQLGGWSTLQSWQRERRIHHGHAQLREDRINWIRWMLGEI